MSDREPTAEEIREMDTALRRKVTDGTKERVLRIIMQRNDWKSTADIECELRMLLTRERDAWRADALRLRELLKYFEAEDMGHTAYACGKEAGCCCGMEPAKFTMDEAIAAHDKLVEEHE